MEGELQKRVGANLRIYRLNAGLSQEKFAERLGVSLNYAGEVERGKRNLSLQSLESLALTLEIDPLDLLQPPRSAPTAESHGSSAPS